METLIKQAQYSTHVSDSFERTDENHRYEPAFRRWLVCEIQEGRMNIQEAIKRFNFNPNSGWHLIRDWTRKYGPEMIVPLPLMTEQEKQTLAALQKQVQAMEKQLEEAHMRTIALNTLIDVAEEKLKINIRKKPGAKQ